MTGAPDYDGPWPSGSYTLELLIDDDGLEGSDGEVEESLDFTIQ